MLENDFICLSDSCSYKKYGDSDPNGIYCFTAVDAIHETVCEDPSKNENYSSSTVSSSFALEEWTNPVNK